MRYDENGVFIGNSRSINFSGDSSFDYVAPWRTDEGYAAYGNGDIHVGDIIEHCGYSKRVTAIREARDELYGDGYFVLLEDGSQTFFEHYGTPRHSGRYPWGSGDNPYQRNADFLGRVYQYRNEKDENGKRLWNDTQIAKMMGMNSSELRKRISLANAENFNYEYNEYRKLKAKGMSRSAIARRMGANESKYRTWDKMDTASRMTKSMKNAQVLKDRLEEVPYIQVGAGAELFLNNATETSLKTTLKQLENEGYCVQNIMVDQLGKGKKTTIKVLTKPGVEKKDIYANLDKIGLPTDIQMKPDGEFELTKPPVSVDPKRVMINYAETGGDKKDGLIEVRRGCKDLSLGRNNYVQGRILVDNDHYLKGMIAYADDLPDGIDIRFNTNKHEGTPMINREDKNNSVLKPIKKDQENIFGANIKEDKKLIRVTRDYIDDDGQKKQSAINIVKEEGDVDDWSKTLPSQFLSKQNPSLAEAQLKMSRDILQSQFDEIKAYSNPVVKAEMLNDFAGRCDRDSVHLAAAALPRQKTKFILPLDNVADNEAYLPGFKDGEEVALVRFPHAHIAEIPVIKVNNNNPKAKEKYGDALDAIGISHAVAEQLSGADFDGDTVLCIPMDKVRIAHSKPLKGLKDFDPSVQFAGYPGMPEMTDHEKGLQMGKVSNLITDMTIKGASDEELTKAIKHSMVVIDAQKHNYDWRRSEIENGIPELRRKYQDGGGASTLLSRSTGEEHIPERTLKAPYMFTEDERKRWEAGENIYRPTGRTLRNPKPPRKLMTDEEKRMWDSGDKAQKKEVMRRFWEDGRMNVKQKTATVEVERGYLYDPYDSPDGSKKGLVSTGKRETTSPIERVYGDHALALKAMANEARAMARSLEMPKADPAARQKYAREVEQLDAKLQVAKRNQPLERQAMAMMNDKFKKWRYDHPDEDKEHQDREKSRLLNQAREKLGAKKLQIGSDDNPLTPKEWEAIENRAISPSKLKQILKNCDKTVIKKYALPKEESSGLSSAEIARAKLYLERGYTRDEICDYLDISESTLIKAIGKANI